MKAHRSQPALPTAALAFSDATSSNELARLAACGNTSAFELIMRRHNRLLFRTARSMLKDDTETEDALQESYLHAWRGLATFRADATLSTWLVRIVLNECLGRLRRRGAQVIPIDTAAEIEPQDTNMENLPAQEQAQPERVAMRAEVRRIIEARIDTLPDQFRTVFMLRAVEELTVEEVAAALDIPEATVRTRFFRARGLLREGLARDVDFAIEDAFSFAGERCDRIVSQLIRRITLSGNNPDQV